MAWEGLDELARDDGVRVELWANLEAFEPGKGVPCGSFTTSQRTTKERLDQAVMFAGPYPAKLISFMWDGYYVCKGGRDRPLREDLVDDWRRPVVLHVFRETRGGREGIVLRGYNVVEGTVEIAIGDADPISVPTDGGEARPRFGAESERYPDRLEETWAPFPRTGELIRIRVAGPGGRSFHDYILADD
jgi:hypothetical protein